MRPWQHVLEPLGGYLKLALRLAADPKRFSGQAFNFGPLTENGSGAQNTVQEIMEMLRRRWKGFSVTIDRAGGQDKKETHRLSLNWEKARRELEWSPKLSLEKAVDLTAAWYEEVRERRRDIRGYTLRQISEYSWA